MEVKEEYEYEDNNPQPQDCGCVRLTTRLADGSLGWGHWVDTTQCTEGH